MSLSVFNVSENTSKKFEKARKLYETYKKYQEKSEKQKEKFNVIAKELLKEHKEYFFTDGAKIVKKILPRYKYSEDAIIAELGENALLRVSEVQAKKLEQALIEKYGDEMVAEAKLKQMRDCIFETESFTFDDGKLTEKQIAFQKKQLEKQFEKGIIDENTLKMCVENLKTKAK